MALDTNKLLRNMVGRRGTEAKAFGALRDKYSASVGNQDRRASRQFQSTLSQRLAQASAAPATAFSGALSNSVRREKARQGISGRGENAIKNQQLKNRIVIGRQGATRRGLIQQAMATAVNTREGVNVGVADANAQIDRSNADLFGGIAGTAAGILSDPAARGRLARWFGFGKKADPKGAQRTSS